VIIEDDVMVGGGAESNEERSVMSGRFWQPAQS